MKYVGWFFLILFALGVLSLISRACSAADEALDVAHDEFGPREALRKYEWFKDAATALDKKRADVGVYAERFHQLNSANGDTPRREWAREAREQLNIWASEVAGIKASYNSLAAEYNAQMAKFNWRFAEAGQLPPGAAVPLPREFKPYLDQ